MCKEVCMYFVCFAYKVNTNRYGTFSRNYLSNMEIILSQISQRKKYKWGTDIKNRYLFIYMCSLKKQSIFRTNVCTD